jgi:uncharacterized protein (UPF0335 family)
LDLPLRRIKVNLFPYKKIYSYFLNGMLSKTEKNSKEFDLFRYEVDYFLELREKITEKLISDDNIIIGVEILDYLKLNNSNFGLMINLGEKIENLISEGEQIFDEIEEELHNEEKKGFSFDRKIIQKTLSFYSKLRERRNSTYKEKRKSLIIGNSNTNNLNLSDGLINYKFLKKLDEGQYGKKIIL